ncbi:hypothetical protein [Cerasicoccus frondis]|uniref:hypothetical protein n=1 Tax=Cerasicoccus frondis TaxID=490090 RepID=UPI002852CC79|nr:hypothetical protein [Cerasicoccus frondis]
MKTCIYPTMFASLVLATSASAAVTLPYFNDFSSDVSDFTTSGTWALSSGDYVNTLTSAGTRTSAALDVTGVGGGAPQDFTITTNFTVTSGINTDSFGLALFGDSVNSPTTNYLIIDFNAVNTLRIRNLGTAQDTVRVEQNDTGVTFANGELYTFTADFDYTGTDLVVSLTVAGNGGSGTIVTPSFDTITTGLNTSIVAYTNRTEPGDSDMSVAYGDLSIAAIPEVSTYGLLVGILGLGVAVIKRRKK